MLNDVNSPVFQGPSLSPSSWHLMMGTELVPETSESLYHLTQLIAQEDFINLVRCETF
jgi:hypothetical protein